MLWEYKFNLYQSDVPAHRVAWASPVADPETGNVYSFGVNNLLTAVVGETGTAPLEVVSAMTLMLAPLAPHMAEEVWARLGHPESLTYEPFPESDPAYLVVEEVEIPVQVNGKVRARVKVPAGASDADHEAAARADERIAHLLAGVEVSKVIVVPGRLVNVVTR